MIINKYIFISIIFINVNYIYKLAEVKINKIKIKMPDITIIVI